MLERGCMRPVVNEVEGEEYMDHERDDAPRPTPPRRSAQAGLGSPITAL
jgi:hypothetical protein